MDLALGTLSSLLKLEGWKLNRNDFQKIDRTVSEEISEPIGTEFLAPPNRMREGLTSAKPRMKIIRLLF